MVLALYILATLAVLFVISGVVPRYREAKGRRRRVEAFAREYQSWVGAEGMVPDGSDYWPADDDEIATIDQAAKDATRLRAWLVARRDQMQRDAQSVGRGVMYVAPPPAIGGAYEPHRFFSDLFDAQTNAVGSTGYRVDELATIAHETTAQLETRRHDLFNPWSWTRLAFERIVGFPRYILRRAGFGDKTTNSTGARVISVVWSLLIGGATIGAFVVGLLQLAQHK